MNENSNDLRPVAFMVMPFRERAVPSPPDGAPSTINCDALWDRAFRPALVELGYLPIRADAEVGAVILKDMLQRLALAELVLADLTLPNGNVYYEVGLRHVAKETHCVLVAADWSRQLFDVDQMRTERYPLKDGSVPPEEAEVIRKKLVEAIPRTKDSPTPYHEFRSDKSSSTVFREQVEQISSFQAQVRAVRLMDDKEEIERKVRTLLEKFKGPSSDLPEVALELLMLVRDSLGWEELAAYAADLPPALQRRHFVQEQLLLAKSKLGDHPSAIAGLEELIRMQGESPERRGLIGGRYKKLWREERKTRMDSDREKPGLKEKRYLSRSIDNYRQGMELNYNEYFCMCNLPGLLRARGGEGDEEDAEFLDRLVVRICERQIKLGEDDGWVRPTLLGAAFRSQDVSTVEQLAEEVSHEGPAAWQLETTLSDIEDAIENVENKKLKSELQAVFDDLKELLE